MPIWLYCLLDPPSDAPTGLVGVCGEAVRSLSAGPLRAWVGTVAHAPAARAEAATAHDRVCGAALGVAEAVLPARFGQTAADDAGWIARLGARESVLRDALARVRGRVEMAVVGRVGAPSGRAAVSPPSAVAPGHAYLSRVRDELAAADAAREASIAIRDAMRTAMGTSSDQDRTTVRERIVTVSHLIARADIGRYRAAAAALRIAGLEELVVTGPSAPASFAAVDR